MNKPLSEWTLKEVQEMCLKHKSCKECIFDNVTPSRDYCFYVDFPKDWELEENE